MALPTASDNPFASLLVTEGSAPSSPAAGKQRVYIDSSDHKLKRKNSSGTVTSLEAQAATFAGCRVTHNTTQNITSGGDLTLAFNSEGSGGYDTDAYHDTSTNNSRLTVPSGKAGYYAIFGSVQFQSNATGWRQLYLKVNNTTIITIIQIPAISGDTPRYEIHGYYNLAVGDYVELHVGQNSGSTLTVDNGANFSPVFGMHLLGV